MSTSIKIEPTEINVKNEISEVPDQKLFIKEEPTDEDEVYPFVNVEVNENLPIKIETGGDDPLLKAVVNENVSCVKTEVISTGEIFVKEEPKDERIVYPTNSAVSKKNVKRKPLQLEMISEDFLNRTIKSYKVQEIALRCQIRNLWREIHRFQNQLRHKGRRASRRQKQVGKLQYKLNKQSSSSRNHN